MRARLMRSTAIVGFVLWAAVASAAGPEPREVVDETALRYYAATRQEARVALEIRRLQDRHPGWTPPDDLDLEEIGPADEVPLWDLFAAGRLDELAATIEARKRREPSWEPSLNLRTKFDRRRLRAEILREAGRQGWPKVADLSSRLRAEAKDPELAWVLAEAWLRNRRVEAGFAALRDLVVSSRDPAVRLATVEKALALLSIDRAEELIALGRKDPSGRSEFDAIADDITRARIVGYLRRQRSAVVPAPEVEALARSVRAAREQPGFALLGWYAFNRGVLNEALDWFKLSMAQGGDAMTAHGLAHTLRRLGFVRDAEDVAYAWREPLTQNAILYTDLLEVQLTAQRPVRIESDRLERYAKVVADTQSGEGAQALAWYAYNLCQFDVATTWFERAMAWFPKEGTALGYAVSLRRMNRQREFLQVVNRYDGLFPRVVDLVFRDVDQTPNNLSCETPAPPARERDARTSRISVPSATPSGRDPREQARPAMFPIPVWSENPRRVSKDRAFALEEAAAGAMPEPRAARAPVVAHRVLGVMAMPYERFGLTLLPAYDGSRAPSPISVGEQPALRGSLWAEQQREPLAGAERPSDPKLQIGSAARFTVPPPSPGRSSQQGLN